jgi:hypothetical protein
MKQKRTTSVTPPARRGDLAAALAALTRLGGQVVARCPDGTCPICAAAATIAA